MTTLQHNAKIGDTQSPNNKRQASDTKTPPSSGQNYDGIRKRYDDIKKSQNDKRAYRGLVLDNEMKVLLISDPTTDKSAGSIAVKIGSMTDPQELPGLAHFCEHMLFLGTEKFPDKNEYHKFLSQHGGGANAVTHTDFTQYYFDVSPNKLDEVLDRFAQFFLKPLFTESATELEINAVNSEHEKNVMNDTWRTEQLDKFSADQNHPYSRFRTGNKQTLDLSPKEKGINVREALLNFHNTWYSSNIMVLSILGKESLDELEKMVVSRFAEVENKKIEAPTWPEHPFKDEHYRTKWFVVPVKDVRYMKMIFPLPDLHEHFRSVPSHYVSHLLGHEGPGSLLSVLKKLGWSDSLMAGEQTVARGGCNFFNVIVDLTEEGIKHTDDIITLLFQYINLLKKEGPIEWIFEEYTKISKINFDYTEKASPQKYVNAMVQSLQLFPIEEVLIAPYFFTDWRPDLINLVTDHLKPENIRVYIVGKAFETMATESEPWYGTKFKKESISQEIIKKWKNAGLNAEFAYPMVNEFIPEDFVIRTNEASSEKPIEKLPVIIEDSPLMRVWFKQDDEFLLPKVNVTFAFDSPLASLDPLSANLTAMYVQLIKDSLNEYAYSAGLAGLSWDIASSKYGIILAIGGYHDKHRVLLEKILDKMVNFTVDAKRFEILKEHRIRNLLNREMDQPYNIALYHLSVLLTDHVWRREDLLEAISNVTVERLKEFIPQFLTKMHVESLIHGNMTKSEALETVHLVELKLREPARDNVERCIVPLLPIQLLLYRQISLDNGSHFLYQVDNRLHKSSCTEIYYQAGLQSTESNMHLELLAQIISEPCFNILRTAEQLGYLVWSGIRRASGVQGLKIIVQSHRHPNYVDKRIELFMETMLEHIENMSDEEFNINKASLATRRLEKPKDMTTLYTYFWTEIVTQQYNFDRTTIEVAYLMTLTKDQILHFAKEILCKKSSTRSKLAVHVVSIAEDGAGVLEPEQAHNAEELSEIPVEIKDIVAFKASQSLYPLLKTFNGIPRRGQRSKL